MANGEIIGNPSSELDVQFDAERAIRAAEEIIRHARGERAWNDTDDVSELVVREMPRDSGCTENDQDSCILPECTEGNGDTCAEPSDDPCYVSAGNDPGCSDGTACPDLCGE